MPLAPSRFMVSIQTAFRQGIEGRMAVVEAVMVRSLPSLVITGLAGDIIKESRERILGCLANLGFSDIPTGRVVVNLCPAGEKKQGSHFDLAIALALLAVEHKIPAAALTGYAVLGELTLEGRIRSFYGAVPLIESLVNCASVDRIVVPSENGREASLVVSEKLVVAGSLSDVIAEFNGTQRLSSMKRIPWEKPPTNADPFRGIAGQTMAKRALQIAIAGRHHLLMVGSPGVGKSLLANASADLQTPLTQAELIETLRCSEIFKKDFTLKRAFRNPHHSVSAGAFLGGGSGTLIPGEVTLAHRGILFMDEFPEFRRDAIEGLREPLESGEIHLHRVGTWFSLPARFTLIAAMNPCPCGYSSDANLFCRCSHEQKSTYSRRISGPILDRMDMTIVLARDHARAPAVAKSGNGYAEVEVAVDRQSFRYQRHPKIERNADVKWGDEWGTLNVPQEAEDWIRALSKSPISLRLIHKLMRVGRTIADLGGAEKVTQSHICEAWDLRCRFSPNISISA